MQNKSSASAMVDNMTATRGETGKSKETHTWDILSVPISRILESPEMMDKNSLASLISSVRCLISELNLSSEVTFNYDHYGFGIIYRYCIENGYSDYSKAGIDCLIAEMRDKYENRRVSRTIFQCVRKIAAMLEEYHSTGTIVWGRISNHNARRPKEPFAKIFEMYCSDCEHAGRIARGSIQTARSAANVFLLELEDMGCANICDITLQTVNTCMTRLAVRNKGGIKTLLWGVKALLTFMHQENVTAADLTVAIPQLVAPRRTVKEGFSADEIALLLSCTDMQTPDGKRDYAIMLAALQTGLRATDIAKLKRQDIDWRSNEIRISQSKTNRPLALTLENESGNAIADYLLNARPKCDLPFVFLTNTAPYRPLKHKSVSAIVSRRMKCAGVRNSSEMRRGFHTFRRTFGTGLLESGISVDITSEMLGHMRLNSAKSYLATHEQGLKECALSLPVSVKAGEAE